MVMRRRAATLTVSSHAVGAVATPSKLMVGITIISPWPGETDSVTFIGSGWLTPV